MGWGCSLEHLFSGFASVLGLFGSSVCPLRGPWGSLPRRCEMEEPAVCVSSFYSRAVRRKTTFFLFLFFVLSSESSSTISSNQSQESGYQSGTIQTATFTSQNSAQGPLYEQRSTQTRRYPNSISSSPQKDLTQAKVGRQLRSPFVLSKCVCEVLPQGEQSAQASVLCNSSSPRGSWPR